MTRDPHDRRRCTAPPVLGVRAAIVLACTLIVFTPALRADRAEPAGFLVAQLLPGQVKALAAGKLLVAARGLPDPNFAETVVLLADYSAQGAMGLIINRQSDVPLRRAFPQLKQAPGLSPTFYLGGPVATTGVLALWRSDAPREDSRHLFADVHMVATRESLEALLTAGTAPDRFRVYLGYAGWGPGQLEKETAVGSWHVLRGEGDLIFDPEPGSIWRRQILRTEGLMVRGVPRRVRPQDAHRPDIGRLSAAVSARPGPRRPVSSAR